MDCTRIDVSEEAARKICPPIYIPNALFETIWSHIEYEIRNINKRQKISLLLKDYLQNCPCKDHYLVISIDDRKFFFKIQTNRRITKDATEIVFRSWQTPSKKIDPGQHTN
jgi:hypothetical protein